LEALPLLEPQNCSINDGMIDPANLRALADPFE
jgi:hypothetical protein